MLSPQTLEDLVMKKVMVVIGLAYGDESKGACVDFLTRKYNADLIVRFNGGGQALHHVVLVDGTTHGFSQFGSGSFVPGVRTYLSEYMLVNPLSQMREAEHLVDLGVNDIWSRTYVHPKALIVTPLHRAINRMRESLRVLPGERHGSCGVGIGVTREYSLLSPELAIRAEDLYGSKAHLLEKLDLLKRWCIGISHQERLILSSEYVDGILNFNNESLASRYRDWPIHFAFDIDQLQSKVAIFEGAQGVLIDEKHGTEPYRTWTDCTTGNAMKILSSIGFDGELRRIGCFRTYFTRHGNGPFPSEISTGNPLYQNLMNAEIHNGKNVWQGGFRVGEFDLETAKYSLGVCGGIDEIAMSHFDVRNLLYYKDVEKELGVPITIKADGPTAEDREERRV